MSKDKQRLPKKKRGNKRLLLSKVLALVPLGELFLHIIKFLIDLWRTTL
jgi:hypothetical protein